MEVLTPTGYRDATTLVVGDHVSAFDLETGLPIINEVEAIAHWNVDDVWYLINGKWLLFGKQSVWVKAGTIWVVKHASDLQPCDIICNDEDLEVEIETINTQYGGNWIRFAISGDHSYIVDGITVHNASRYWVGGSANWDGTAGSKWSGTSGGAGGSSLPGTADKVFIDANSGAVTVTKAAGASGIHGLDFSGFTGTFAGSSSTSIAANSADVLTFSAGMTLSYTGQISSSGSDTLTVTCNGQALNGTTLISNGIFSLADAFATSSTSNLGVIDGEFKTNNHNVTAHSIYTDTGGSNPTWTGGTSTFNMIGSGASVDFSNGTPTISMASTTIKFNSTASICQLKGQTAFSFGTVWYNGSGAGGWRISGSNTISELKDDGSVAHELRFEEGQTQTITTWNVNGSAGQLISIRSITDTSQHTLSAAGGPVTANYLDIMDSVAIDDTWTANNSVDSGNNSGWSFAGFVYSASKMMMMFGEP